MNKLTNLSDEEINSIVIERLKMGESIESIRFDLKNKGIDLNEIVKEHQKNSVTDKDIKKTISQLKNIGLKEDSIKKELNKLYGVTEEQYQNLKVKEKKGGVKTLIFGLIILAIGILYLSMGISTNRINIQQIFLTTIGSLFTLSGFLKVFKK